MKERRKYPRFDSLNLSYVCVDQEGRTIQEGMGRTLNVSESGILLETYFPMKTGQIMTLTVAFENDLVDLPGKVVHCDENNELFNTGVEFLEFDQWSKEILQKFIDFFEKQERTAK